MNDLLFSSMPNEGPDRLTQARIELERAEEALAHAEAANDELPLGTRKERDAVAAAEYELRLAEYERLHRH